MYLKKLEINGFKSFAKKEALRFDAPVTAIVGPNGSGKSNVAEAFRWVLGEQSMKSLRGKKGEDLIFNGSGNLSRLNRASVSLTFDNSKKQFDIDFPEVVIERVVFRDGVNEYYINGTQVRLRDVIELLSAVSLGASSHHIINQNEADRILIANAKDRKQMVEDALGLRIYHWKIAEGKKKLEKTKENIKDAQSIRREISGHLRFLQKETEKIEKVKEFKNELLGLYETYLQNEKHYIHREQKAIKEERKGPEESLNEVAKILDSYSEKKEVHIDDVFLNELSEVDKALADLARERDELSRNIGKVEGIIEFTSAKTSDDYDENEKVFSIRDVNHLAEDIERLLHVSESHETLAELRETLAKIQNALKEFKKQVKDKSGEDKNEEIKKELEKLNHEKAKLEKEECTLSESEEELKKKRKEVEQKIEEQKKQYQEKERAYFEAKERRARIFTQLEALKGRENNLSLREESFKNEIQDIALIFGPQKAKELNEKAEQEAEKERVFDEVEQITKRKDIERLKIRIEEVGPGNEAVLKEYEEVQQRDQFLEKEIEDLQKSEESLVKLIKDLEQSLSEDFKKGVAKINDGFQKFFEILFGGGKASISVVNIIKPLREQTNIEKASYDEEEKEEGIGISVSLPRKKIRGLEMLSGGEKALTSIALLFAMTQVKPPPFLILDETDAALDEANSRKYGDMLESLAKETQLIVITHNRETMSRAGVLYGVTMGTDSVSKLLSVKFDEAVQIAK